MESTELRELATPKNESKKDLPLGVDMKKVQARNKKYYEDGTEIARNERKTIQILKKTRFYKKDQVVQPSVAFADEAIAQKTAKELKLNKGEWVRNGKVVKPRPKKAIK